MGFPDISRQLENALFPNRELSVWSGRNHWGDGIFYQRGNPNLSTAIRKSSQFNGILWAKKNISAIVTYPVIKLGTTV